MLTSYTKAVKAESLKLKRSPVWLAFFALPMISAFFGTMNYKMNIGILKSEWYSLWSQHTLFLCYLFMPALIGTYCSYLWRLEHTRHNWNSFLTAPLPLSSLYLGKLTQAVRVSILGNLWIFALFFICVGMRLLLTDTSLFAQPDKQYRIFKRTRQSKISSYVK